MNAAMDKQPTMAWYRVPEVWLILILLGASVTGSFVLLGMAIRTPDVHITVPNDVPRPSRIPPIRPTVADPPDTPGDHGPAS